MNTWAMFMVASGGAIGALLRFFLSTIIGAHQLFPWATLTINIAGSFAIGLIWGAFGTTEWFAQWGRLFLIVGLLGGFTTFSAFSLETLGLLQNDRYLMAAGYAVLSVAMCLFAVYLGERAGQGWLL